MFYQMFYTSEMIPGFTKADLARVLEVSRRNNALLQLTGMLITHEGKFFQVLEGPKRNVEKCFALIGRDKRHRGLAIVSKGYAKQRAFSEWRMAYHDPADLPESVRKTVFSIYKLVPPRSPDRSDDPRTQEQVRKFLAGFDWLRPDVPPDGIPAGSGRQAAP